ncbi:glycosyl hydrolase family 8 [Acuticoccus sp. M5D2P5]|uniref:glycosyl hydrolase family 8 n=1 Tax=Acuticoccus kalidii TaxID=2910977 RepID=UPI001F21B45D|nr:glycosyl hydrolase family 8 [Acuticoccus kalidii]MCF3933708.1 glycosyl hydrolase family 8 [Acuticoccus kalidii]
MRLRSALLALLLLLSLSPRSYALDQSYMPYLGQLPPAEQQWFAAAFQIYRKAFIQPDGRVFDPQNGGITHSESQGYGMLLALLGSDPETFDLIWRFAKAKMQRADKLFAWKWVPGRGLTDRNNASDGEILIATALGLAGMRWDNAEYIAEATAIAEATGTKLIREFGGFTVLLPGEWAAPTPREPDPTLNLSYYIPLTLPVLEALAPDHPWEKVMRDGDAILDSLIHPPSDWSTVNAYGEVVPARGFPPRFSYDAVRIPLYLMQLGRTSPKVTRYLMEIWPDDTRDIYPFDVFTFARTDKFWGKSYVFIYEMLHCLDDGTPISADATEMKMTNYFDTSLHLMAIAAMYAHYPECFPRY